MTISFLSLYALLLSLVIIGEALALGFGTYVMGKGRSWRSVNNNLILVSDITAGIAMLCLTIIDANLHRSMLFFVFVTILLITHAYRHWEYLEDKNNIFCSNKPLLIVNNFKLVALAIALIYVVANP